MFDAHPDLSATSQAGRELCRRVVEAFRFDVQLDPTSPRYE